MKSKPKPADRIRFAARYAARHLLLSAGVAAVVAWLVFRLWYPFPLSQLLDVGAIFLVLLAVDAVCGPLLTLILASPAKSVRERWVDFSLIGIVQLAALGYGIHTLAEARPVAYVFEQDRLVVVAKNELYTKGCETARCPSIPYLWGTDWHMANLGDHKIGLESIDLSLQGVSPAMRPATWQAWDWNDKKLQSALRPLSALGSSGKTALIDLKGEEYAKNPDLVFLPIVSSKTLDWIAVFNTQGKWLDALPIDGFNELTE